MLSGGSFRHGFQAGAIGEQFGKGGSGISQVLGAAVVGGTVSSINGCKFANGAMNAAFVLLFNHAAHKDPEGVDLDGNSLDVFEGVLKWAEYLDQGSVVRQKNNPKPLKPFYNLQDMFYFSDIGMDDLVSPGGSGGVLVRKFYIGKNVIELTLQGALQFRNSKYYDRFYVTGITPNKVKSQQLLIIYFEGLPLSTGRKEFGYSIKVQGPMWESVGKRVFGKFWSPGNR